MGTARLTDAGNASQQRRAEARRESIRALRAASPDLTHRAISETIGVSVRTVERALSGWSPPAPPTPAEIAAAERKRRTAAPAPGTATPPREHAERGKIMKGSLRRLNATAAPFTPTHEVGSDAERAWAQSGASRIGTGDQVHGDGLVRMQSPDGTRRIFIEPADVEHRLTQGWVPQP